MRCPYCHFEDSKVIDKRETGANLEITRRRRECLKCSKRFTTYEEVEASNLIVVKKDGRREIFDKKKILGGITRACEKRPVSLEQMENMVHEIEQKLRSRDGSEIPSHAIGEEIMNQLAEVDKVAYIRFASVYREFADIDAFSKELQKLLKKSS
jgi:transcriptional repressor NrdR